MDYLILLVSVASLSANIYLVKKVSDWFKSTAVLEQLDFEPKILDRCSELIVEEQLIPVPSKEVVNDESKYAWKNATGLPAAGPPSISPSKPAPKSGPLERPYGFPG